MISNKGLLEINRSILKYPIGRKKSVIMAALTVAQREYGWLSLNIIKFISNYLKVPEISVLEIATFYHMYDLYKIGKCKITLCTNLSCKLAKNGGSDYIEKYLKKKLNINFDETTSDGIFTLKESECMGVCGDAPVLLVNNHIMYSFVSVKKIDKLIKEFLK